MSKRRKSSRGNPARQPEKKPQQPKKQSKGRFLADANQRAAAKENSSPRILVYVLAFVAAFMFFYLHIYALPQLRPFADGLSMPGARFTGYSVADIEQLRAVMEGSAAGQLSFLHSTAGIIFPVSVALATWAVMGFLARDGWIRRWRWVAVGVAVVFAALNITENVLIDRILGHSELTTSLVSVASALTSIRWVVLIVLAAVVLAVIVRDLLAIRRERAG